MKKIVTSIFTLVVLSVMLFGCSSNKKQELIFADADWDSIKFNNALAGFIAESAFGYEWKEIQGSSAITYEGLKRGEIDIYTELWTDNIASYKKDRDAGQFKVLGSNLSENMQGLYVPRYVIEGDPERGIEAMAPNLKTVEDLKNYKHVFVDDENKNKGRIYGAIPGWEIDKIMYKKYEYYGLDKDFVYFNPGSQAAMNTVFVNSYEKGLPLVGYNWEPTWIMGKYDFVLLEDAKYDLEGFKEGKTECPSADVRIIVSNKFYEDYPEYSEFLNKFSISSQQVSEVLAHMQDTGASHYDVAIWFLKNNDNIIDKWLDADKAKLVRDELAKR